MDPKKKLDDLKEKLDDLKGKDQKEAEEDYKLYLKKFVQNMVLYESLEEMKTSMKLKKVKVTTKSSKMCFTLHHILHHIARMPNQAAVLTYTSSAVAITFRLRPGEFVVEIHFLGSPNEGKRWKYIVPSFEDPKFDPQKIINIMVSTVKDMRRMSIKYRKLDVEREKLFKSMRSDLREFLDERPKPRKGDKDEQVGTNV